MLVKIRYYIDPSTGAPHIYNHSVEQRPQVVPAIVAANRQ
jgi:hypothetical protein